MENNMGFKEDYPYHMDIKVTGMYRQYLTKEEYEEITKKIDSGLPAEQILDDYLEENDYIIESEFEANDITPVNFTLFDEKNVNVYERTIDV